MEMNVLLKIVRVININCFSKRLSMFVNWSRS